METTLVILVTLVALYGFILLMEWSALAIQGPAHSYFEPLTWPWRKLYQIVAWKYNQYALMRQSSRDKQIIAEPCNNLKWWTQDGHMARLGEIPLGVICTLWKEDRDAGVGGSWHWPYKFAEHAVVYIVRESIDTLLPVRSRCRVYLFSGQGFVRQLWPEDPDMSVTLLLHHSRIARTTSIEFDLS